MKLSDLKPDAKNSNKGTARGLKMIEASLQQDGFGRSILVDKFGNVVAGNKTLESVANTFGVDTEVIVVKTNGNQVVAVQREDLDLTDPDPNSKARRLAYRDNLSHEFSFDLDPAQVMADFEAGFDFEAIDISLPDLGELLGKAAGELLNGDNEGADTEPQIDKADELRVKWSTEPGQLWQLGDHRLICGDCTDAAVVERVMGGEKADCGFTSPPYAVGVDYGETYKDTIDNLRGLLPKISHIFLSIIKDGGFAVLNFGDIASGRNITETDEPCEYPMSIEYWPIFRNDGWLLWSRRIWCKPNPRVHSPWCIQSNRAATDFEHLWTFKKPGTPIIKRVDGELRSALGWIDTSLMHGVDEGKKIHGAGMAVGIAEWMINIHSYSGNVVFEPFLGTGTTLIGCNNLKRKCYGCEISPGYVAVALQRWADHTGQTPVLINRLDT